MLAQQFPDEILGRRARQFAVEVEHQHRGRASGEIMLLPLFERGQTERRRIWLEMAYRVRIEGGDDRGAALFACPGNGLARHRLVAKVEAIEIAQRDDRAAQRFGQLLAMVEPPHAVRSRVTKLKAGASSSAGKSSRAMICHSGPGGFMKVSPSKSA